MKTKTKKCNRCKKSIEGIAVNGDGMIQCRNCYWCNLEFEHDKNIVVNYTKFVDLLQELLPQLNPTGIDETIKTLQ